MSVNNFSFMTVTKTTYHATACLGTIVSLSFLFVAYSGDNCYPYSSDEARNLTASVTNLLLDTSVVNLLSKTCDASKVSGLFENLVLAAFFLQYVRQAISWKQLQLQRCILVTPPEDRDTNWCPSANPNETSLSFYHSLTFLSSAFYLLSISFILTQNIYVFASITAGNIICEHVVLRYENSDEQINARRQKKKKREDSVALLDKDKASMQRRSAKRNQEFVL